MRLHELIETVQSSKQKELDVKECSGAGGTTTSGGIATVAKPLGGLQRRDEFRKKNKKKKK